MKIAVLANDDQWKEINTGISTVDYIRMDDASGIPPGMDAFLMLKDPANRNFLFTPQPVLLNAVCSTLKEMNAVSNTVRFNGWNTFLSKNTWEVSGTINSAVLAVFAAMGKNIVAVPDEPGFVSARITAMIINEAFFALQENVSTKEDIDTAMKLGTNYPYGPFEWAALIGEENVFKLLDKLSMHDNRYLPAPLLKAATTA